MSEPFFTYHDAVTAAVTDLAAVYADRLSVNPDPLFVARRAVDPRRRVALVSGGGSGHEPLHSGFVGRGMLDAAVPGKVFASPHNRQVYEASRAVAGRDGVLHIVKNYTGDRINFGIAAERLRDEGIFVDRVLVDDDVASESVEAATGRRGTGATVIVEKILGAAADTGLGLAELKQLGDDVVSRSRSIAVARCALTLPSTGDRAFELAADELEYGVGIHGERAKQTITRPATSQVLDRMLAELVDRLDVSGDAVAVLVNGLGATTGLELHGIHRYVQAALEERGIQVQASLVGTFVAALDMAGFSLTLTALRPGWADLLLAPTDAPSFPRLSATGSAMKMPDIRSDAPVETMAGEESPLGQILALASGAHGLLTDLDRAAGDGDFGDNLIGGLQRAAAISPDGSLATVARTFLDDVGGSSGPLIGLLFQSIAAQQRGPLDAAALIEGYRLGLEAIQRVGGARPGDRTLVDALHGAAAADDVLSAARAAAEGARSTADMRARLGRASYVGERAVGTPDPGAVGTALIIIALACHVEPGHEKTLRGLADDWL